ncbi:MAG: histidine kinase dimerization/phosphoacceptor domain -containing protein [Bacteroidota bacterium]
MKFRKKSFSIFKLVEDEFKPYYTRENDFGRLVFLHSFSAFITCPIFCYFVSQTEVSAVYYNLAMSYTVLFPVYALLGFFVKSLQRYLMYFFIVHLFVGTVYCFQDLIAHDLDLFSQYSFFCMYALFVFILQRFYPVVLYNFMVLGLMLFGFQKIDNPEISTHITFAFFTIIAICGTLIIWARRRMIKSIEDYSSYLKQLINDPEISFILFHFLNSKLVIIDSNTLSFKLLDASDEQLEEEFIKQFNEEEIEIINELRTGQIFEKEVPIGNRWVRITVSEFMIQKQTHKLARIYDITKAKEEKKELEDNEKRYKDLFYKNQSGMFTTTTTSVLIDYNKVFEEFFESELAKGDKLSDYIGVKEWNEIVDMMLQNETIKNYQTHFRLKNGSVKWFIFNWFMAVENQQITGIITDITNTQKTALQLSLSEEKYRLIFQESNDIIFLLEGDTIIDTNRRGYQSFGIPKSELIGQSLWNLSFDTSEEFLKEYTLHLDRLKYSKHSRFQWKFKSKSNYIDASVVLTELNLENKVFYQCVIHDETEIKKTMNVIEKSHLSFKSITENSPDGMLIIAIENGERKIVYTNPELFKLFQKEEVTEQDIFRLEGFEEVLDHHIENDSNMVAFCTMQGIDGESKNIKVLIINVLFEDKESSLVILRDVSIEQKMIHEKLRAELAEETSKNLMSEINERVQAEKRLQEQFLRSSAIFNSSQNTLLITLNKDFQITYFNIQSRKHFYEFAEIALLKGALLADLWKKLLTPADLTLFKKQLIRVLHNESIQFEMSFNFNQQISWIEIYLNPIFDTDGNIKEISLVGHDISEKKMVENEISESLKEKEILLKEIHHRVKNNMQIISSILNLQSSFVKDKKTLEVLSDSRNRIRTMAIIHESLYQTNNFSSIDFSSYVKNLCSNIIASYYTRAGNVELNTSIDKIFLLLDQAIPCGLIINELITNSLKYAFVDGRNGIIDVELHEVENEIQLKIMDNGVGLPENFDIHKTETLGMQLVSTLVEQLEGKLEIMSEDGIKYLITFDKLNS